MGARIRPHQTIAQPMVAWNPSGLHPLIDGPALALLWSSASVKDFSDTDDSALVRALANGDQDALGVLYDRYVGLLLAVGIKILGERSAAEDIAHDVFLESWRKAGTFDDQRGTVRTWLLLRMRSRCVDRKRSAAVARSESIEKAPDTSDHKTTNEIAQAPDRRRARAALTTLSDDQRKVVELSFFAGLSYSEIATEVGVPLGTVKSRMRLAVASLRGSFAESREVSP